MAGFCVGVVEKSKLLDGSKIQPGDVILGVPSNGLHSNGYSLIRKIVFEHAGLSIDDRIDELNATVGEVLLKPTRIYADVVKALMSDAQVAPHITGIAHITGGGLIENTERILPEGCRADIDLDALTVPPVFNWLQQLGDIQEEEMWRVFNMGVGMTVVVRLEAVGRTKAVIDSNCFPVNQLGTVAAG